MLFRKQRKMPASKDLNEIYGDEAIVDVIVRQGQEWRVRYLGSFWPARAINPSVVLAPNDVVEVVGRQSITLLIRPRNE